MRRYASDTIIANKYQTPFLLSHACTVKVGTITLTFYEGAGSQLYKNNTIVWTLPLSRVHIESRDCRLFIFPFYAILYNKHK